MSTLDGNSQKTPLAQSLQKLGRAKAADAVEALGKGLPCTVASVQGPGIVTVNFAVATMPAPLAQMMVPVLKPPYVDYPIQVGDVGIVISVDLRTGGLSGLGTGVPNLQDTVANLSALHFIWIGKTSEEFIDPAAVVLREPTGNCNLQVGPAGVLIAGPSGNLFVNGNLGAGNGATGVFTTPTGQTVIVTNGIITNIF